MNAYDVLVIGGGPAGSAAALRLARAGVRVALAEKEPFPRRKVCGEYVSGPAWSLLRELGIAPALLAESGPAVERVGLYAGPHAVEAAMPGVVRGRAIGRHRLDTLLLRGAADAGAHVWQPAEVDAVAAEGSRQRVRLRLPRARNVEIVARCVVDAHGSWTARPFAAPRPIAPSDLLGFKARFTRASLPVGLMPLVLFPGGYAGLVHTDSDCVSFSCCIRHDTLRRIRRLGASAGDAVFMHVSRDCRGFREALGSATPEGPWIAAGPIRPGLRALHCDGIIAAGNAAGEAHPLVAEGISMAIQSGWLLAEHLARSADMSPAAYEREWRSQFAARIRASQGFAWLAAAAAPAMAAAVRGFPAALTWGAWLSGKAREPRAA